MLKKRDTDLLIALGKTTLISESSLMRAQKASDESNLRIEQALVELGLMKDEDLADFLSSWLDIPHFTLVDFDEKIDKTILPSFEFMRNAQVAPVSIKEDEEAITFACVDPQNMDTLKTLEFHLGKSVHIGVGTNQTIMAALDRLDEQLDTALAITDTDNDIERLVASANDGPVVNMVQDIIAKAVDNFASDIHIESQANNAQIRYRIDGMLSSTKIISSTDCRSIISRLKIMADLNISEIRRPQDGRIRSTVRGRDIDLRLSTLPTQFGESVVMRVLDQSRLSLNWNSLGFDKDRINALENLIHLPNGIILVTGPTGSGKTTTLYTALSQLDTNHQKIITVEDPIEYSLPGINQVQVHPEIDVTFAAALRTILRQDPDVILVGEIRDSETAENAVRAALMGRLVLSTIHTNSAVGAIDRLLDLGVPSFLLGATLRGILSQRLVRKTCSICNGVGCSTCQETGYVGRQVASELLEIDTELQEAISSGLQGHKLFDLARRKGFRTLQENTQDMILDNLTTEEEAYRAAGKI